MPDDAPKPAVEIAADLFRRIEGPADWRQWTASYPQSPPPPADDFTPPVIVPAG